MAVRIGDHNILKTGEEFLTRKNVHVNIIHKHEKWIEPKLPGGMLSDGYDVVILELAEVLDLTVAGVTSPAEDMESFLLGVLLLVATELVVLLSDRLELSLFSLGVMAEGFIIRIFGDFVTL